MGKKCKIVMVYRTTRFNVFTHYCVFFPKKKNFNKSRNKLNMINKKKSPVMKYYYYKRDRKYRRDN